MKKRNMAQAGLEFVDVVKETLFDDPSLLDVTVDPKYYNQTTINIDAQTSGLKPRVRQALVDGQVSSLVCLFRRMGHTNSPTRCEQEVTINRPPSQIYGSSFPIRLINLSSGKWNPLEGSDVRWRYPSSIYSGIKWRDKWNLDYEVVIRIPNQDRRVLEATFDATYLDTLIPEKGRIKHNFEIQTNRVIDACNSYREWKLDSGRIERIYVNLVDALIKDNLRASNFIPSDSSSILNLPQIQKLIARQISRELA